MANSFIDRLRGFEEYEDIISIVCKRFKNAITSFDVIYWLNNFKPEEYETALTVLKYINYFDDLDIIEAFNHGFKKIIENLNQQSDIYIMSIGLYGKSGSAMIYFLNKTNSYKYKKTIRSNSTSNALNHNFYIISSPKELIEKIKRSPTNNNVVIMIDDFFGSGDSVIDFYYGIKKGKRVEELVDFHEEFNKLTVYPENKFLSVASMTHAVDNIINKIPHSELYCENIYKKAFEENASPFGYRGNMVPIREFCYSYGKEISSDPLGYKNTQSLVVFSYGTPNNTLPIIWAERKWNPIFPRFYEHKASKAKEFRADTAFQISFARSVGIDNINILVSGKKKLGWKDVTFVTKTDFLLFGLLRLKMKKVSRVVICQTLGIRSYEYESLIADAIKKGLLDGNENFTEEGNMLYYGIVRQVNSLKKASRSENNQIKMYVPKSFGGYT